MTNYATLISAQELFAHYADPAWAIFDCRFDFRNPGGGEMVYREGHIAGAVYAHLERDLALPASPVGGRHPLPPPERLARTFSGWGIHAGVQVVAYDDAAGGVASRLWWCLRYLGHEAVAVLDGGWRAWTEEGLPVRSGEEVRQEAEFVLRLQSGMVASLEEVSGQLGLSAIVLIDSRAPERYLGIHEDFDPVAGHIPGARNRYWRLNADEEGRMLPAQTLRHQFERLLGDAAPRSAVFYCGSGVTACQNLLAMVHAGLEGARLYPGSWSEWVSDLSRPVATGEEKAHRQ